ncbi:pseudouridine synthase [Patellaria atrata CBS 101060]|uniref:tRNA pseudouridine synthase 1 n=1 Tax=Patellaria atrata CBS 101060 TaxID=1346257 RepID=A0A9P4VIS2_9PEZI|nr:pseudouridine synthase [Patellaria atrata CBS 101060]
MVVEERPIEPVAAPNDTTKQSNHQRPDPTSSRGKKRRWENKGFKHGSRAPRSGGQRGDTGRVAYFNQNIDKRARNDASRAKRQKTDDDGTSTPNSVLPAPFAKEEIDAEERRPKRKVAVLIGYSGTGYKGMQINTTEKTIEGDLFTAFVKAGAISKANADDPKKSTLVRCARTDKGVHAAGNVISLKLIVEDPDIVKNINEHLPPQIRVWGIERTIGSFSCYQACDSRWYEYLIPTHSFLPPHPSTYLGRKSEQLAKENGDLEGYRGRQKEVEDFWSETEKKVIRPILDTLDETMRKLVEKALYEFDLDPDHTDDQDTEMLEVSTANVSISEPVPCAEEVIKTGEEGIEDVSNLQPTSSIIVPDSENEGKLLADETKDCKLSIDDKKALNAAIKALKSAYLGAKRAYRISRARIARIEEALSMYEGTKNYHNFTINKTFHNASANRHIKSFKVNPDPIMIHETEWLSLKVHGQSFMMHQIRKMVGMATLVVRCGCPISRIQDCFGPADVSIPKAPGIGLLLERPVFDTYNGKTEKFEKEKIDFGKYEVDILEFKQREIYDKIFLEEEKESQFNTFFSQIDNYKEPYFLYLTSGGIAAAKDPRSVSAAEGGGSKKNKGKKIPKPPVDSEDERDQEPEEG